jgi:hypothetical protein
MRLSPDEIEQRYQLLPPISPAWLKRFKELGVSVDALCEPELPGQAQVILHDGFFDFAEEADGTPVGAVIFLARDEEGALSATVSGVAKAVETYEIAERLAKLEEHLTAKGSNP